MHCESLDLAEYPKPLHGVGDVAGEVDGPLLVTVNARYASGTARIRDKQAALSCGSPLFPYPDTDARPRAAKGRNARASSRSRSCMWVSPIWRCDRQLDRG